ncbi:MAG: hypothetical protein LBB20_02895 [Puniceicoccales bacterium]|jgi:hypothetical protein|nr:hypothetical protein [Puniceicoccales bacterium]
MTNWIKIIPEDLYDYLVAQQVDALRKQALAKHQIDPIMEIIKDVSSRIRSEIKSNRQNVLSATAGAIPLELKSAACSLILEIAQTRIPGLKLSEDQIRLADQARESLRRVAKGEVAISVPDEAKDYQPVGVEVVTHRENTVTGETLGGF